MWQRPWRTMGWALGFSLACFVCVAVLAVTRPFGVLEHEAPMTTPRRVTAGGMIVMNLGMYAGLLVAMVAGVRAVLERRRVWRRICAILLGKFGA